MIYVLGSLSNCRIVKLFADRNGRMPAIDEKSSIKPEAGTPVGYSVSDLP